MRAWRARFVASIQNLSSHDIALLLSVGLVLGVFPIPGIPTLLCIAAAFGLRINAVALQLINQVTGPLQFALVLPLACVGRWLCGHPAASLATRPDLAAMHAVAGWALLSVPAAAILYLAVRSSSTRVPLRLCSNSLESLH